MVREMGREMDRFKFVQSSRHRRKQTEGVKIGEARGSLIQNGLKGSSEVYQGGSSKDNESSLKGPDQREKEAYNKSKDGNFLKRA